MKIPTAGAPTWFKSIADSMERMFVQVQPLQPIKLQFHPLNDLPDVAKYEGHLIYVVDPDGVEPSRPAVSNGTAWLEIQTGTL